MCGDVCHRNEGGRGKGAGGRGPGKPPSEGKTRVKASVGRGPPETRNRAECADAEGCTVKGRASADDRAWGAHALPRASGRPPRCTRRPRARGPSPSRRVQRPRARHVGVSAGRPRPRSHVFCPSALSGSWPVVRCPPGRGAPYSANPADTRTDTAVCASRSPARGRVRSGGREGRCGQAVAGTRGARGGGRAAWSGGGRGPSAVRAVTRGLPCALACRGFGCRLKGRGQLWPPLPSGATRAAAQSPCDPPTALEAIDATLNQAAHPGCTGL